MKLPPLARIQRGQQLYDTYSQLAGALGDDLAVNPAELGQVFATHDAELVVTRVTLAVAASRKPTGFPEILDAVADAFGGSVPTSPYDGSALTYEVLEDGKGFSLGVAETKIGDVDLPGMEFKHLPR